MIRRLAAALALVLLPAAATACPEPSATLIFHSCWHGGRLGVVLLPEDLPLPGQPEAGTRLTVTGAYTARDDRGENLRKPVGLFIHKGAVINPNLGRMDGILVIDPATGVPELQSRHSVRFAGEVYDLTDLARRRAFIAAARAAGVSVLQSHLLIVDGHVDVREQETAPAYVRRLLFADAYGFGLYQSTMALTLHDAARDVGRLAPRMALNLDMGSYDFCLRQTPDAAADCGVVGPGGTEKLSNLLVFESP